MRGADEKLGHGHVRVARVARMCGVWRACVACGVRGVRAVCGVRGVRGLCAWRACMGVCKGSHGCRPHLGHMRKARQAGECYIESMQRGCVTVPMRQLVQAGR